MRAPKTAHSTTTFAQAGTCYCSAAAAHAVKQGMTSTRAHLHHGGSLPGPPPRQHLPHAHRQRVHVHVVRHHTVCDRQQLGGHVGGLVGEEGGGAGRREEGGLKLRLNTSSRRQAACKVSKWMVAGATRNKDVAAACRPPSPLTVPTSACLVMSTVSCSRDSPKSWRAGEGTGGGSNS